MVRLQMLAVADFLEWKPGLESQVLKPLIVLIIRALRAGKETDRRQMN